ncbi:MAG: TIGR00730 family Rossman fold protein [Anaerolineales bacterium]|jgi:hypothetical protein|nr:TIGR00730 family Rossman fold protein [Anaerolineales bacterium]
MKTICVYCGSSDRVPQVYLDSAYEMGQVIGRQGLNLVYGAGKTGLMGAVADGVLSEGGEVIGVIPQLFNTPQLAHARLTRLEVVTDMHTRKARLIELADAMVALPGGYGTFEEFFEALTWAQIGLHSKPIGLLNVQHYFEPLLKMVSHAQAEGMIYDVHRALFVQAETPAVLLANLQTHQRPQGLERWLTRED